jgi:ribosomal protein L11 methyltransferase
LRRVAVEVPLERAEEARATFVELFPGGFEEVDRDGALELVAYTDGAGEENVWGRFSGATADDVEPGWEERWRAFHRPVRVGRLWVGPPWEDAPPEGLAVVIDPGRAFGTGAHPTTQLCLGLLQQLEPSSLLDVGCGSGVLSIAAALLGYEPVIGIDVEGPAVEATLENAARNGVHIDARLVDPVEPLPEARTTVANISLGAVEGLSGRLACDWLVTSGYLEMEHPALSGYTRVDRKTIDGWAADLHRRA